VVVIGFDTATPATAVALLRGDGRAFEARDDPAPGERPRHAGALLQLIERVLGDAGAGWDDVERIAVGTGPGSFTGLRIGVATARALAQARGVPVVGVSTLAALAAGAAEALPEADPVLAVLDARRGEAFAAAWSGGRALGEAAAMAPDALAELAAGLPATPLAVGDGAVRFRSPLERAGAVIPGDDSPLHRVAARHVCRLGARAPEDDRDAVLPEYVRAPDARPRPS
jgi:tRNA threonylcarbamoyladenosine biosynthesis protein TsaB